MRVADNQVYSGIVSRLGAAQSRLLVASNRASSGLRMQSASDDPVGAAQLVRIRSALSKIDSYQAALRAVSGDCDTAESVLAGAEDLAIRVHAIALQGAHGSTNAEGRTALALEVRAIRDQMLAMANTKGTQGYMFAGTLTESVPFNAAGVFVGNDQPRVVQVSDSDVATVNVSGALAFTAAGGQDVFAEISALESALASNNQAAVMSSVGIVDAIRRQILAARVDAGMKADRLATAAAAHDQGELLLRTQQHDVADADPAEAYSRLVEARNQVDQSLAASRALLDTFGRPRFG